MEWQEKFVANVKLNFEIFIYCLFIYPSKYLL
jgi:hypothetical protein